jgi:hypothetical protein
MYDKESQKLKIPKYPKFKNLEFEDLDLIRNHLRECQTKICELSAANLFIWKGFDDPRLTCIHRNLCILITPPNEPPFFLEPLSHHDFLDTVDVCLKHAGRISRAHESFVSLLPHDAYLITPLRSHFDYLYRVSDLAELKGKKYDGKRNHIKKFKRHYPDFEFVSLGADLKDQAIKLFEDWFASRKDSQFFVKLAYDAQKGALESAFSNYKKLNLFGAAIMVSGQVKAFILASGLNPQTVSVHFLYYHPDYPGISQTLLQEACQKYFSAYIYANLEQDLGIPGLRTYKLSYHPLWMEKKFEVTKKLKSRIIEYP